jgi:hypothetical protein
MNSKGIKVLSGVFLPSHADLFLPVTARATNRGGQQIDWRQ